MSFPITAEFRTALRKLVTADPRWDTYRTDKRLSLATMTKADWHAVMADFGIDASEVNSRLQPATTATDLPAKETAPVTTTAAVARAKSDFDPTQFRNLATDAEYDDVAKRMATARIDPTTARTAAEHDTALAANARADFDAADNSTDAPEFDAFDIPEVPVPVSPAQLVKIDNLIALAVDESISFRDLYLTARRAVFCASSLRTTLEFEREHNVGTADPHAKIVKSSLDFVAPSWSRDFLDYLDIGATVAVVGPSGNGKTTGARKLLERAGWNVYEFDCTDATLPQDLIGRTSLRQDNGATVTDWQAGPLALAFADPKGAVLLNEYDALDPRTGMALQSALESSETRRVTAPDTGEQIRSHGPCPIVLTLNTIGHGATVEYQGRNALDGANRDRVEIIVTGYESEAEILVAHGYAQETADRLASWARDTRAKLAKINSKEILSNRRLLTAAALIDRRAMSLTDAVTKSFYCRMPPREFAQISA